jgi:hypothetical protein
MLEVVLKGGSDGVDGQSTRQIKENWTNEQERLQGELRQDLTIRNQRAGFGYQSLEQKISAH